MAKTNRKIKDAVKKQERKSLTGGKPKKRLAAKKGKKKHTKKVAIAGAAFVICAFLLWAGWTLNHWNTLRKMSADIIYDNIYIGDINVSGMTRKEAKAALDQKIESFGQVSMTLAVGDKSAQTTLKDLGLQVKGVDSLLSEAMQYGKSGGVNARYRKVKKLKKKAQIFALSYQVEEKTAKAKLEEVCTPLEKVPVNATVTYDGTNTTVVDGKDGVVLDADSSADALNAFLSKNWNGESGSVEMVSKKKSPAVTADQLGDVKDVLGSYETYYGEDDDSGRVTNIKSGGGYINGTVLMPGEEFSADAAMRPYTEERGYAEAGSYENGTVVETLGGGICQVSTTLYNAVLYAELEVTERQQHSMLVSYVDPSRDAAIADDVKDLKFKNSTDYPICILCDASGGYITFTILGKETRPENRTVEYESEILSTIDYQTQRVQTTELSAGQESTKQYGHKGATARLWKSVYVDGEQESREVINNSNYAPSDTIIEVGVGSGSSDYDSAQE